MQHDQVFRVLMAVAVHLHVFGSAAKPSSCTGAGSTSALVPAIPILLDMAAQNQTPASFSAASCLATLTEMFPQEAASGVLSGDGLLLLADGLQQQGQQENATSQDATDESEGADAEDASKLKTQHLLTSLVIACRFQPSANIMAGDCP